MLDATPRHTAQVNNFGATPSQTVGPYFAYGLTAQQYGYPFGQTFDHVLALPHAQGQRIRIEGHVFDGDGKPVPDAIVEISHADAQGHYPASREQALVEGFTGWGRCGTGTDAANQWGFDTVMPGAEAVGYAPCVHVVITMRGLLTHVFTRIYFDGHPANATDPVLAQVALARRNTLIATPVGNLPTWRFDVHMQGANETAFLDI